MNALNSSKELHTHGDGCWCVVALGGAWLQVVAGNGWWWKVMVGGGWWWWVVMDGDG